MMRKPSLLSLMLTVSLVAIPFACLASDGEDLASPVRNIRLGDTLDAKNNVIGDKTEFLYTTKSIFASTEFIQLNAGDTVDVSWVYIITNQTVSHSTQKITDTGPSTRVFTLTNNVFWPVGDYELDVYVNGVASSRRKFEVSSGQHASLPAICSSDDFKKVALENIPDILKLSPDAAHIEDIQQDFPSLSFKLMFFPARGTSPARYVDACHYALTWSNGLRTSGYFESWKDMYGQEKVYFGQTVYMPHY